MEYRLGHITLTPEEVAEIKSALERFLLKAAPTLSAESVIRMLSEQELDPRSDEWTEAATKEVSATLAQFRRGVVPAFIAALNDEQASKWLEDFIISNTAELGEGSAP